MQLNGVKPIFILRAAERMRMKPRLADTALAESPWVVVKKQLLLGGTAAILMGGIVNAFSGLSVLAGVLCISAPSAYFAWSSQRTLLGERILAQGVLKVVGTVMLMAVALESGTVTAPWFLLGIAMGQGAYFWALVSGSSDPSFSEETERKAVNQKPNEQI
jgi:hypothetical protein